MPPHPPPAPVAPAPRPPSSRARRWRPAAAAFAVGRPAGPHFSRLRSSSGQASVELVALLPVVLLIVAFAWQAVLAGQAVWNARVAARAAARAHSFGADPADAARAHLPRRLERGLRVTTHADGDARVSIRVPAVMGLLRLGRVSATSHFRPQS